MIADKRVLSVIIADPLADGIIPIMRVPTGHQFTIEAANASADADLATSTADYASLTLYNAGTDGLQTDAISNAIGGTPGWAKNVAKAFTVVDGSGKLTAGQWLAVKYDEEGTVALGHTTVCVEYVDGIGANANA